MSILTDLRAALGAKREIDTALFKSGAQYGSQPEYLNLHALLTDDTIRALLDVAERSMQNTVCVCGKVWRYENHYHADNCPLAPLVKEADHDRA